MALKQCSPIAKSAKQVAFAVLESIPGKIAYPTSGHAIFVAGDALVSQTPEFENSTEKRGTRDVADQFRKAMPPATSNLPTIMRSAGLGNKPQAHDLLVSLFGSSTAESPVSFFFAVADAAVKTLTIRSIKGRIPPCGVISNGTEKIRFEQVAIQPSGEHLLSGCQRGYAGTTAKAVADGAPGTLLSLAYFQEDCNPSFTLWVQTDHIIQAITGATVNEAKISLTNSGGVSLDFSSIQGMTALIAGTALLTQSATAGTKTLKVESASYYDVGMKVWNPDAEDDNSGQGYIITATDSAAATITLAAPIAQTWPADSFVTGWLPEASEIGETVKGGDTGVLLDGTPGTIRSTEITYGNNISYLTDEVGTTHPQSYVEDSRSITLNQNQYFLRQHATRFKDGLNGTDVSMRVLFNGGAVVADLPRVKAAMPKPKMDGATVSLDVSCTALAQRQGGGNNAFFLVFN